MNTCTLFYKKIYHTLILAYCKKNSLNKVLRPIKSHISYKLIIGQ